jgi:ketosteroid isomerase-like protein
MTQSLLAIAKAYLRGIEEGDLDAVIQCYAPHAEQIEWPNRLKSKGDRRGPEQMAADFARGKGLLAAQSYEVLDYAEKENYLILEVLWRATLAVPLGNLAKGDEMVAHSAIAFSFEDGKIVSQRNYDCFEEF